MKTKQTTFKANNKSITIKAIQRLKCGNPCGFNVFVNGNKYFVHTLYIQEAMDNAYSKWVKDKG